MRTGDISGSGITISFTDHAGRRAQQRSITILSAQLATTFGKKSRVPGNRFQRVFTKRCVDKARLAGIGIQDIEAAIGVPVICDESAPNNRTIVSVLPKTKVRKRN